jgi:hypothetical protein
MQRRLPRYHHLFQREPEPEPSGTNSLRDSYTILLGQLYHGHLRG